MDENEIVVIDVISFFLYSFFFLCARFGKMDPNRNYPLNGRVNFKAIELNGKIYLLVGYFRKGTTNLVDFTIQKIMLGCQ